MKKNIDVFGLFYKNSLIVEAAIIFIVFQILTGGTFLSFQNLSNLLMQGVTCSIIAITMCLIIVTCNADLSAGRFLGMLGMIAALLATTYGKFPDIVVILLVYAIALIAGLWHGAWIGYLGMPAFIVTLATQLVFLGVNQLSSGGRIITIGSGIIDQMGNGYIPHFSDINDTTLIIGAVIIAVYVVLTVSKEKKSIEQGLIAPRWNTIVPKTVAISLLMAVVTFILFNHKGFSWAMLILFVLTLAVSYISNNTRFGRYVYAIGGNKDAAALSGINVSKELMKLYLLHAVIVATAALVYLGRLGSATTAGGNGYEFTAITGCVVGGTAITGGRGKVTGAVVGTMIMATLDNGMSLMNVDASYQYIIRGVVLLLAIMLDTYANNRQAKTVQAA